MNHAAPLAAGALPPSLSAGAVPGAYRAVHRAIGEARRGVPVLIGGMAAEGSADGRMLAMPAETASDETLAVFAAAMQGSAVLLMSASPLDDGRAEPGIVSLPVDDLTAAAIRRAADPTHSLQPGSPAGTAAGAAPAFGMGLPGGVDLLPPLALAKLARLLPAMLIARLRPGAGADLLGVDAHDVMAYPMAAAAALLRVAEARVPMAEAPDARIIAFRPPDGGIEHLAILIGDPEAAEAPLVRIHSECFTGDLLGSLRCDCGPQLHQAIRRMAAEGAGVVLYMAQEGRGIGLVNKLRAYTLQDAGLDTLDANRALGFEADERSFTPAATMLKALGIIRIRLLTNNPDKVQGLTDCGIAVVERISHAIAANGVNDEYLETKARRFGHLLG